MDQWEKKHSHTLMLTLFDTHTHFDVMTFVQNDIMSGFISYHHAFLFLQNSVKRVCVCVCRECTITEA